MKPFSLKIDLSNVQRDPILEKEEKEKVKPCSGETAPVCSYPIPLSLTATREIQIKNKTKSTWLGYLPDLGLVLPIPLVLAKLKN
jgi:hypothetical protein